MPKNPLTPDYDKFPAGAYIGKLSLKEQKKERELQKQFENYLQQSDFLAQFPKQHFKKDEYIVRNFKHKGYRAKTLAFVHEGLAKGIIDRSSTIVHRRPPVIFLGPGKWLGLESHGHIANMLSFVALKECSVSLVPLQWVLEEAPKAVLLHTFRQCANDLQFFNFTGAIHKAYSLKRRILEALSSLCCMTSSLELNISREDMAHYIGVERQYLSKTLKELEVKNLVSFQRGRVTVHNIDKLYDAFLEEGNS